MMSIRRRALCDPIVGWADRFERVCFCFCSYNRRIRSASISEGSLFRSLVTLSNKSNRNAIRTYRIVLGLVVVSLYSFCSSLDYLQACFWGNYTLRVGWARAAVMANSSRFAFSSSSTNGPMLLVKLLGNSSMNFRDWSPASRPLAGFMILFPNDEMPQESVRR